MNRLLLVAVWTVFLFVLLLIVLPFLNADQTPCEAQVNPESGMCGLSQPCACAGDYNAAIPSEAPHRNPCCSNDNMRFHGCKKLCSNWCTQSHCHCKAGGE